GVDERPRTPEHDCEVERPRDDRVDDPAEHAEPEPDRLQVERDGLAGEHLVFGDERAGTGDLRHALRLPGVPPASPSAYAPKVAILGADTSFSRTVVLGV